MKKLRLGFAFASLLLSGLHSAFGAAPELPGVTAAIQKAVEAHEISGAVTAVVTREGVVHLKASGMADLAAQKPMRSDSLF